MRKSSWILLVFWWISNPTEAQNLTLSTNDSLLIISDKTQDLLTYYHGLKPAPTGVSKQYTRSGFIHPLKTPHGQVLTQIQPKDHYHHYGLWNPWTHVLYEGDTLDFWNLNAGLGTVRFAGFINKIAGDNFQEFTALHEHVVLKNNKNEVALNERQTIKVAAPQNNAYTVDITIEMSCATSKPFKILAYRYGGLGWRTTAEWNNKNSTVLTSENKSRKDADGSTAKWCLVQGQVGNETGGILLISNPQNFNHPEPLRIWPENQYGRGDLFVNFAPTKTKDWELLPGQVYILKYRLLIFDGIRTAQDAQFEWNKYISN